MPRNGLETINMLPREERKLDVAQIRVYRRALGLAPPYIATQKGLEYIKNEDILTIPPRGSVRWSERVQSARARLLKDCQNADPEEPIRIVLYQNEFTPRTWPGRKLPGATNKRGTWLQSAMKNASA